MNQELYCIVKLLAEMKFTNCKGAFTYDVRLLGRQVGQAESDFTTQACVVKYLIQAR